MSSLWQPHLFCEIFCHVFLLSYDILFVKLCEFCSQDMFFAVQMVVRETNLVDVHVQLVVTNTFCRPIYVTIVKLTNHSLIRHNKQNIS